MVGRNTMNLKQAKCIQSVLFMERFPPVHLAVYKVGEENKLGLGVNSHFKHQSLD